MIGSQLSELHCHLVRLEGSECVVGGSKNNVLSPNGPRSDFFFRGGVWGRAGLRQGRPRRLQRDALHLRPLTAAPRCPSPLVRTQRSILSAVLWRRRFRQVLPACSQAPWIMSEISFFMSAHVGNCFCLRPNGNLADYLNLFTGLL